MFNSSIPFLFIYIMIKTMAFKRVLILIFLAFACLFGILNQETSIPKIKTLATIYAPKTNENDVIAQKNNSFSIANISNRNTHLKNHQNNFTNGTLGALSPLDLRFFDSFSKLYSKKSLNNQSLARNFLLIQKRSTGPPRNKTA